MTTQSTLKTKRIYHTWDKWECYPCGFYEPKPPKGMTESECQEAYRSFLDDDDRFREGLDMVVGFWPKSCEHYLTNENMNRIAWLGQSSMCIMTGVPSRFLGGFFLLTDEQQAKANATALEYLNKWLASRGDGPLTLDAAQSKTEMNLY